MYSELMPDAEFQNLIAQNHFAKGAARRVFEVPSKPDVVVKEVLNQFPGANMVEWFIWNWVKDGPLQNLFGKCLAISQSGRFLMMERLEDLKQSDYADLPKFPAWLNDRKSNAFGKSLDGIKVRDYGILSNQSLLRVDNCEPLQLQLDAMEKRKLGVVGW